VKKAADESEYQGILIWSDTRYVMQETANDSIADVTRGKMENTATDLGEWAG
jgi:hypothetical protein